MNGFTVIDLFSGIGGLSLGFELEGFRCVAGVEQNPEHVRTFEAIHPEAETSFRDVSSVTGNALLGAVGLHCGALDVLIGGPPCQPFSMAGKRRGSGDARGLAIYDFVRLVRETKPRAFVMENVVGLQSIHGGAFLHDIRRSLAELGYTLTPTTKLNAAEYGVPQLRKRIFIVGLRDRRQFEFAPPTHASIPDSALTLKLRGMRKLAPFVGVDEAIADLPCNGRQSDDASIEDTSPCKYASAASSPYQRAMRKRKTTVTGNKTSVHFEHIVEAISQLGPGDEEPKTRYRRLYPDRPAFTLRAGSGTFTALRPIHPHRDRVITVREAARLQSFPDRINFNSVKKWAYQGIGNSVPPMLAAAIARRLQEYLE
jgi:DNA (cytosine-5)-methyltransferase 1